MGFQLPPRAMTLDDLEHQNRGFYRLFGDFGLRHTFQERIVPKSLEIDRDSLRTKLSALNVVFTYYLRQWNEVNTGGDYEIGRSVCLCTR